MRRCTGLPAGLKNPHYVATPSGKAHLKSNAYCQPQSIGPERLVQNYCLHNCFGSFPKTMTGTFFPCFLAGIRTSVRVDVRLPLPLENCVQMRSEAFQIPQGTEYGWWMMKKKKKGWTRFVAGHGTSVARFAHISRQRAPQKT
ncbi:hypothetical protein N7468_002306 [Penicillium chermesinum]|uniref:Uncharacterized protein n=1 Tax=Penicillium chermesinum TaxID=63820 RepID=A0A9W9PI98_9EURO|nr:uncharacterized protein N7468_002306 [Penicillium chermesinum]KAJ5247323.1 hypothetical protein N7468_002306 [Penicillium chermesinum]KAJ6145566.1 hypothetical protein N7470_009461 [Penicillium chermesinum]